MNVNFRESNRLKASPIFTGNLTDEQEAIFQEIRQKCADAYARRAPADRPRAEAAFARACVEMGTPVVPVIWVGSPLTASIAISILQKMERPVYVPSLRDLKNLWTGVFWNGIRGTVSNSRPLEGLFRWIDDRFLESHQLTSYNMILPYLHQADSTTLSPFFKSAMDSVISSGVICESVSPGIEFTEKVMGKLSIAHTCLLGQFDTPYYAACEFFWRVGFSFSDRFLRRADIIAELGESCSWWYPMDGCIVACDRPCEIRRDEAGLLHNDSGPAIIFRDSLSLYHIHGISVPEWLILTPDLLSVDLIDQENNAEVRRVMIDRFGVERYVREGGAQLIASDSIHGDLYLKHRDGDTPIIMLRVRNNTAEPDGTVREYWLRIHPECRPFRVRDNWVGEPQAMTPRNARASTWGLTGDVFEHLADAA